MNSKISFIIVAVVMLIATDAIAQGRGPQGGGRGGRGGPPGGRGPQGRGGNVQLVDQLQLNDQQRASAQSAIAAYEQTIRQQTQQARTELLAQMEPILSVQQFLQFQQNLEQVPLIPAPPNQLRGVAPNELTTRLLSYDANQDGRIQKEELPERMLGLIEQGDTNSDGALDRTEINSLAARNSIDDGGQGRGGGRGGRGGRGGPGGGRGN